jgi:hypothetical protein
MKIAFASPIAALCKNLTIPIVDAKKPAAVEYTHPD